MRAHGICYDTGFFNRGVSTHEPFDPDRVRHDLRAIRERLHCDAVRLTGGDAERLKLAASHAADAGLEVWLCPFTNGLSPDEMLRLLADCAEHAERLRQQGVEVVVFTGSELSITNTGFLPGASFEERGGLLATAGPRLPELLAELPARINAFLGAAVAVVRERFGGKVGYASLPFERVDWTPFDIIATDAAYRSLELADQFVDNIRAFVAQGTAQGKPVAITEFGCASYKGAADSGGRSHGDILEWDAETVTPHLVNADHVRDEDEQARYLRESLDVFTAEGVDAAFAYVFARFDLPHSADPRADLDLASPGVVKVYEDGHWEPKSAFHAIADYYGQGSG